MVVNPNDKMKKLFLLLMTILLVLSMVACTQAEPQINAHNLRIARIIVNTVDDYLDGKIDVRTAYNTINEVY